MLMVGGVVLDLRVFWYMILVDDGMLMVGVGVWWCDVILFFDEWG